MPDKILLRDRLNLDPAHGTFDLNFRGRPLLQNATAQVTYRDDVGNPHRAALAGGQVAYGIAENRLTISRLDGRVELVWNAVLDEESYVWLQVVNRGREPIWLECLHVLSLDSERGARLNLAELPAQWRFFQNGWQSWSAAFVRATIDGLYADPHTEEYRLKHLPHSIPTAPRTLSSEWVTVISCGRDSREPEDRRGGGAPSSPSHHPSILIGFVTTADQLAEVRLQLEGDEFARLEATSFADGLRLEPGDKLVSEKLLLAFGNEPLPLLERYAERLGETMHARVPASPLTGWCTWYYFYGEDRERDVIANLERIRAERLPLKLILIDDGYQTFDGDWTDVDADKFPQGLKWLAGEIKRAGHVPALWVAPFAANENSRLVREHPEFLLRDAAGAPVFAWRHWGAQCYALDLSRADVQAWLRQLFQTLSDDWGFELFKLDFTYTAAVSGIRADPKMTRAQALRRGLEIIRQVVGDKTILGCGAPFGPAVGLLDAMRIGPDVSINWEPLLHGDLTEPSVAYALRNTMTRAFVHNRLWQNDPDCVLVRRRDDESELVLNEMRTMVSIIGLSGGAVLSSDNLPSIRRGRLKYLKQILPPTGSSARAVDMFEHELPRLFVLPVKVEWGEWLVVGALNWDDRTTETEVALESLGLDSHRDFDVYDFWHRRYAGVARERYTIVRHQPHETRLLLFKAVSDRTELLTTTFHVAQGASEVKRVERRTELRAGRRGTQKQVQVLRIELEKEGRQQGEVLFAVRPGQKVVAARVDGRLARHRSVDKRIVSVGLTLDERATIEIETSD